MKILKVLSEDSNVEQAKDFVREALACRQLTPSPNEDARISACTDLATLKRWHRRAFTAASVADALE